MCVCGVRNAKSNEPQIEHKQNPTNASKSWIKMNAKQAKINPSEHKRVINESAMQKSLDTSDGW